MSNKLTQEEINNNLSDYLKWQEEYNKTGNVDILWFNMHPYLKSTAESLLKKLAGRAGKPVIELDSKSDEVADIIIARYLKDRNYSKKYPITMVYWACVGVQYSDSSRNLDAEERYCAIMKEQIFDELYRNGESNGE